MKRGGLFIFAIIIFIAPLLSAVDTQIHIKTIPEYQVQVSLYDATSTSFSVLEGGMFREVSDEYGDVNFVFSSSEPVFNVIIYIKNKRGDKIDIYERENGELVKKENPYRILEHTAGEPIDLRLAPKWFEFVERPEDNNSQNISGQNFTKQESANKSAVEEEQAVQQDSEKNEEGTLTGKSIFGENGIIPFNILYYVLAGFGLLIVIFATAKLTAKRVLRFKQAPKKIKITKLSELKKEQKNALERYEKIIQDAEAQIKKAKEEMEKIKEKEKPKNKNQEKIDEIKKKIEEYEKEIIKLRQGESKN